MAERHWLRCPIEGISKPFDSPDAHTTPGAPPVPVDIAGGTRSAVGLPGHYWLVPWAEEHTAYYCHSHGTPDAVGLFVELAIVPNKLRL
jgi:hypothetical protein